MAKKIKVVESFPKPEGPPVPLRLYIRWNRIWVENQEGHAQIIASLGSEGTLILSSVYGAIREALAVDEQYRIIVQ